MFQYYKYGEKNYIPHIMIPNTIIDRAMQSSYTYALVQHSTQI